MIVTDDHVVAIRWWGGGRRRVQTLNPTHRRPVEAGNRVFGRCAGEKVAVVRGDGRRRARGVIMSRLGFGTSAIWS